MKDGIFGKLYEVRIEGVDKGVLVSPARLNMPAKVCIDGQTVFPVSLPKGAQAYVKRVFYEQHKKFTRTTSPTKRPKVVCPVKLGQKLTAWCARAQVYVCAFNAILKRKDKTNLLSEVNQLNVNLKTPKDLQLTTSMFLDGSLQITPTEKVVLVPSKKLGYITCNVCGADYNWSRVSRALKHICCAEHNKRLKDLREKPALQGLMLIYFLFVFAFFHLL